MIQITSVQFALLKYAAREIEAWRSVSMITDDGAWVFPSERMKPMSKDNCWNRNIKPKLQKVGLGWANFLVTRRTHSTLMGRWVSMGSWWPINVGTLWM